MFQFVLIVNNGRPLPAFVGYTKNNDHFSLFNFLRFLLTLFLSLSLSLCVSPPLGVGGVFKSAHKEKKNNVRKIRSPLDFLKID